MAGLWTKITDIPVKLFVDNVLPFCEAKDVVSLGCANKFFALVANNNTFWRRKVAADYNSTGSGTTRKSGWKAPYHKLNPRVFVWGCVVFLFFDVMRVFIRSLMHPHVLARLQPFRDKEYGQLGLSEFPETTLSGVPVPVELRLPGVRVASMAMGEQSVQIPFPISVNTPISYYSCIPTVPSTYLALTVVCMCVVRMPLILSILR